MGWNPWRELRRRHWLTLEWVSLAGCHGQLVEDHEGRRRVQLDWRLSRRDRSAVLAHELVHDERGLLGPEAPPGLIEREEWHVRRITAERLVPRDRLVRFVARRRDEGVTVMMVAEEFDVPEHVAELACHLALTGAWS